MRLLLDKESNAPKAKHLFQLPSVSLYVSCWTKQTSQFAKPMNTCLCEGRLEAMYFGAPRSVGWGWYDLGYHWYHQNSHDQTLRNVLGDFLVRIQTNMNRSSSGQLCQVRVVKPSRTAVDKPAGTKYQRERVRDLSCPLNFLAARRNQYTNSAWNTCWMEFWIHFETFVIQSLENMMIQYTILSLCLSG